MYNSNFMYFISTQKEMNGWRNIFQNINLCPRQKSKELILKKDYVTDWATQQTGQPYNTKPTVLSNQNSAGLSIPFLPVPATLPHIAFPSLKRKKFLRLPIP